jgi:hypothetical protein
LPQTPHASVPAEAVARIVAAPSSAIAKTSPTVRRLIALVVCTS